MELYTDRYIAVGSYEEYVRLISYWRSNLDYEIIYAVDTQGIISEELFNDNILLAAWLHEESMELEIDILNLSRIYMTEDIIEHLESLVIVNSRDII